MDVFKNFKEKVLNIHKEEGFNKVAIELFKYQAKNNPIYAKYIQSLDINPDKIDKIEEIPFIPTDVRLTYSFVNN